VIRGGIIKVNRRFDQSLSKNFVIKINVRLRIFGECRDMMNALYWLHNMLTPSCKIQLVLL
jgi:hypothetical protein